ncbi:sialate O-acetylesterase [Mucilaginibacter pedocola]|uniref:9-O-acetylesterase n=1 Tax=Mucilaginibacter pedocola TaxID=1792845 RepID=A0A1S9P6X3_9SPHI|nr:sialate O-acetylesterase [Mucilaginibacter pedocola]OOQ56398.1 9-O-acetylesterase [Mucilaginibacter pedocola]
MKTFRALIFSALAAASLHAQAKITLPSVLTDNMVLQQKTKAALWGKAEPGKLVTVSTTWSKKQFTAVAGADGQWKVLLATPSYGGPYDITISDGEAVTLKNVLIGEVWIASGQSNMEMPVSGWSQVVNYQQELADANNYPSIRLLQVEHITSTEPLDDAKIIGGGWLPCDSKSVAQFSAVAYFFARDIYKKTGIPMGIIHSSWGGTIAEAWESEGTVKQLPDLANAYNKMKTLTKDQSLAIFNKENTEWQANIAAKDGGYQNGVAVWAAPGFDASGWKTMQAPGSWESSVLPDFDGIVWFRKKVTIPESWAGKDVKLSLGAIDDNDITFFNGDKIGETNFYAAPRNYTVPADKVKAGEAVITVRAFDTGGDGGFMGKKGTMFLEYNGERIQLEGAWQYKAAVDFKGYPTPVLNDGPNRPSVLFNAMLNPFTQYAVKGAIWYQGEANTNRAQQYGEIFPALINDWRRDWNNPKMPFYFVQLANFMPVSPQPVSSAWAELRDVQRSTLALPYTGMAVAIDIGEGADIHPHNKQDVGHRLALIALAKDYGQGGVYSGPMYTSQKINGNSISLKFKNADGLTAKNGEKLSGFAIAGDDQKFYWADATISGNTVTVSSPDVKNPVAVRYAWANNPVCNLYNAAGLPASPFRTDSWQYTTFGKK